MNFCQSFANLYGPKYCTMNMHLHGHLANCIRDYGPVYSFWCFAFERMNGILGSYPINNHHISLQLTRRYLESKVYAPINWPKKYADEYLPFLHSFQYNKGSLKQDTIAAELAESTLPKPLPPITEYALLPEELDSLCAVFDTLYIKDSYKILILCRRSKALCVNGCVIGTRKSRHSRSSLVLAKKMNAESDCLAEIIFFLECVIVPTDENTLHATHWVAAVHWFMDHPCKVWFGNPTQVWCTSHFPGHSFILVPDIISRMIYTKELCNFGRLIGSNTVYVTVPLDA